MLGARRDDAADHPNDHRDGTANPERGETDPAAPSGAGAIFFFSSRRRHTRFDCDWSSDVCSSDLTPVFRVTTQSQHSQPRAANHLGRRFAITEWERDRAWVADITYLQTLDGWLYLAVVLDVSSRRVIGWCADRAIDQSLTLRALQMALINRRPRPGFLHHSDKGVQYASAAYQALFARHGGLGRIYRRGRCCEYAV